MKKLFRFLMLATAVSAVLLIFLCHPSKQDFVLAAQIVQQAGSTSWTGTPPGVLLTWTASTTSGVSYNIYRGTTSGGPYTPVNTSAITATNYVDTTAAVSTTYYYVATAVLGSQESAYSNQASITTPATFPANPAAPSGLTPTAQ